MKQPEQTKEEKTAEKDWTTPDENGILHIPDRLDDVFNRLGHYLRVHTISGHNEIEVIAYMTRFCDEYASQKCKALQEENERLKERNKGLESDIEGDLDFQDKQADELEELRLYKHVCNESIAHLHRENERLQRELDKTNEFNERLIKEVDYWKWA